MGPQVNQLSLLLTNDNIKMKQNHFITSHLTKVAVKYIEWTVVMIVLHVFHKIFHFQFNRISSIILTALETLIPKPSCQSLSNKTYPYLHSEYSHTILLYFRTCTAYIVHNIKHTLKTSQASHSTLLNMTA